jgi:hypothetical protein
MLDNRVDASNSLTWGLDPLFHVHVKLPLSVLPRMTRPPVPAAHAAAATAVRFHAFGDGAPRPLRLVHVAGVVVHVARFTTHLRFVLDDASGAVGHCVWFGGGAAAPTRRVVLGAFVAVHGALGWAYDVPEVKVEHALFSTDPNAEMLWWLELARAHRDVYSVSAGCVADGGAVEDGVGGRTEGIE